MRQLQCTIIHLLKQYVTLEHRPLKIRPQFDNVLRFIGSLPGYNMTAQDREGLNNSVLTYHRIVEAFKFAYAYRALLGDQDFANVTEVMWMLLNIFPRLKMLKILFLADISNRWIHRKFTKCIRVTEIRLVFWVLTDMPLKRTKKRYDCVLSVPKFGQVTKLL